MGYERLRRTQVARLVGAADDTGGAVGVLGNEAIKEGNMDEQEAGVKERLGTIMAELENLAAQLTNRHVQDFITEAAWCLGRAKEGMHEHQAS